MLKDIKLRSRRISGSNFDAGNFFFLIMCLMKSMMTGPLNPDRESFFVNCVANRGKRFTEVPGFEFIPSDPQPDP